MSGKQLRAAGLGYTGASRRARSGKLHREHRSVYAVGHEAKPRWAAEVSALLAGGDLADIGYRSALEVWGVLPPRPGRRVDILVTTPRRNRRGITVHRTRRIDPQDRTRRWDLPVTTIERALLDAAEQIDYKELEAAYNEALAKGLTKPQDVYELLARSPGRRGAKRLKALLHPDDGYTRNKAERLLRALMPAVGAGRVIYNAPIGPYKVDAYLPDHNLAVEIDGYDPHYTPVNFAADLERQNDIKFKYKIEVVRFAYRTLKHERDKVIAALARAT